MNKSLLLLSRIENNQYTDKREIKINEVVKHVLDDFTDLLQFKKIVLESTETAVFKIVINPDLAYILISNLVRNAVKYNSTGGKIIVTVHVDEVTIQNVASVSKTIVGIALLKAQELGKLKLDEPINKYLPFKVFNPKFPNENITIR